MPETKHPTVDLSRCTPCDPDAFASSAIAGRRMLEEGTADGSEMRGWLDLPQRWIDAGLEQIIDTANRFADRDTLVVLGIGGSYLGAQAVLDALGAGAGRNGSQKVVFAGTNLCPFYHQDLLDALDRNSSWVNVVSKSGTTTETSIALRLLLARISADKSTKLGDHIVATTDATSGALRKFADGNGISTFEIPQDVGGRYSVLSPVGLLPLAAAGVDIEALLKGAAQMARQIRDPQADSIKTNPALAYSAFRLGCHVGQEKRIEVLSTADTRLRTLGAWWKQLFGESEGKDQKGVFPATLELTGDLHSMGQWMQDGTRNVFETAIDVVRSPSLKIPQLDAIDDNLASLAGMEMGAVNRAAMEGSLRAHWEGGVPCARIQLDALEPHAIGALLYLFEYSCAICAYALGVNPFNQPGVERYKQEMRAILAKNS